MDFHRNRRAGRQGGHSTSARSSNPAGRRAGRAFNLKARFAVDLLQMLQPSTADATVCCGWRRPQNVGSVYIHRRDASPV
jgi:hypothetical protein